MKILYGAGAGAAMVGAALLFAGGGEDYDRIRVAFFPNIGHAVPVIGIERGIFADSMGETAIETRLFDSGPQAVESLFAGAIDVAYVGPGSALSGFLNSESGIVILAGAASGGSSFVVHPDSAISAASDLAGKAVAAPQIANTQDVSLRSYMAQNGLDAAGRGGSTIVINVANPEIHTLFAKGDIDAAWVPEPWATILVNDLGGSRLFYEESLWPEGRFASVLLVARADYARENPGTIQRWLEAHDGTVSWINENPGEAQDVFSGYLKKELRVSFGEGIIGEAFENIEITSDPVRDSVAVFAQRSDELGYLGRDGYSLEGIYYDIVLGEQDGQA